MPKIDITPDEQQTLLQALEMMAKSSKRAQNTARSPQLGEIFAAEQRTVHALAAKIANSK